MAQDRWRVSGHGEVRATLREIDLGDQAAGEQAGVEVDQEAVGAGEHFAGRRADGGVGMNGRADLSHEGGGGNAVALDIADRDGDRGVVAADGVVEVSTDVHSAAGG